MTFDTPGVVALGCNIHDAMSGFVFVTKTPFAGQTDGAGRVAFPSVPAGAAVARVWHPFIRAPGGTLSQPLTVVASGTTVHLVVRR
ncbi:cupredoxin domain-containing protein [Sphingomonas sp. MMS24-JH45]